ncbi:MAG: sigma-54 dependent transcriptional regulator [Gemmatimonadetes bacterium]|nr:sigma-54 dependent transcriptional regulator [Gemmatimonadota bacterium]
MSRILIVDDNETMRSGIALVIERMGCDAVKAASGAEALLILARQAAFDLVITDFRMAEMDGLQLLEAVRRDFADTDAVIITAHGTIEIAVRAMQTGAVDFITKPFPMEALRLKVQRVLDHRADRRERDRLGEENEYLREEIGDRYGEIVGRSRQIAEVLARVEKVAAIDSSVLIYGESGTGKELVARAIHNLSPRRTGPFVKVNCGALPVNLVESELFGHEKGAFTGALKMKKGKFELASGGTIFLDEIGDIPLETQVNLLRVLQEKEFDRVGGERTISADVRVVAATNQALKERVADGSFREDLFYRLEVIPMHLAPLRERRDDIPLLVDHFLRKKCREMNLPLRRLSGKAVEFLCRYPWPGNVRELENVIERTVVLVDREEIGPGDLPIADAADEPGGDGEPAPASKLALNDQLESLERDLICRAMEDANGVKTQAAELLGVKTSALYYKLEKYGMA